MKFPSWFLIAAVVLTGHLSHAATLHEIGASASTRNNFGAGSDSDSGNVSASASITLPNGENGKAYAHYNGAIRVRADSSTTSGEPGNGIVSDALQATLFDITSSTVPQDTLVEGRINIHLHGRIQNVGNSPFGGGEIALLVDLRQRKVGPDAQVNVFTGDYYWNMGNSGIPTFHEGFENFGVVHTDVITGDPFMDFSYSTTVLFQGFVGDQFTVQYRLHALSGGTTRVNFSDTGTFDVSFENPEVLAVAVPPPEAPALGSIVAVPNGDKLVLSWEGGPDIRLQESSQLSDPTWSDLGGSVGLSTMELDWNGGSRFFRLLQP